MRMQDPSTGAWEDDGCEFRGPAVRIEPCADCNGSVGVKVFGCKVLGECTIAKRIAGLACCGTCDSYQPPTSPTPTATPAA